LELAIVKDLVERYEGRISVNSTVGEGTTFTVVLPIAK
jgi:signal transduction histidine kinase